MKPSFYLSKSLLFMTSLFKNAYELVFVRKLLTKVLSGILLVE